MAVAAPLAKPDEEDHLALIQALRWFFARRLSGARPGPHRGRWNGSEGIFADLAPLQRQPDPRRIDLRRSISDPFGEVYVRRFATPAFATARIVVDLSASLGATGSSNRHRIAALLAGALAGAARLAGDAAALAVARGPVAHQLFSPARDQGYAQAFFESVADLRPSGRGVEGLLTLAAEIPPRANLVFVISDFEISPEELAELLASLEPHALLPIWLRDSLLEGSGEAVGRLPRLVRLHDPESGGARSAILTRARRRAWIEARAARRAALDGTFQRFGRSPVEILDSIDVPRFATDLAERRA